MPVCFSVVVSLFDCLTARAERLPLRFNVTSYKELKRAHWSVHSTLTCADCGVHPIIGNASMHVSPPKYALCPRCFTVRHPGSYERPGWVDVARPAGLGVQLEDSDDEDIADQTEEEAQAERKAREETEAAAARVCPGTTALNKQCVPGSGAGFVLPATCSS